MPDRRSLTVDPGDDHVRPDGALEIGRCALGHNPALVDDAHPVGQLVGLLEVLRGQEDGHAQLLVEPAHLGPHADPAHRVEPRRGLVEEQDIGVVHQGGRQVEAPLHAARVGPDALAQRVADVDQVGQLGQALVDRARGEPVQASLQPQQLDAGLPGIERGLLQGHADVQPDLARVGHHVVAGHHGPALGGGEQRAQHQHGGRLAGPVGTEEAVDLAGRDVQVDVVDGHGLVEAAHQALGQDGVGHGR